MLGNDMGRIGRRGNPPKFEGLEPRLLLTTVAVGGVLEFQDAQGSGGTPNVRLSLLDPNPDSTAQVNVLDEGLGDIDPDDNIGYIELLNVTPTTRLTIIQIDSNGDTVALGTGQAPYDYGADGAPGGSGADSDTNAPAGTGGVRIADIITSDGPMDAIIIDGLVGTHLPGSPPAFLGTVDLAGSINLFYCGFLDADFSVAGDLGKLMVATNVGGGIDPADGGDTIYRLGDIVVDGAAGEIAVGGSLYKNVSVADSVDSARFIQVSKYEEMEWLGLTPDWGRIDTDRNDTIATGEPVGSFSGGVVINGDIEGDVTIGQVNFQDFVDMYLLSLEAGQEVTISLGAMPVGIAAGDFDADGVLDYVTANYDDHAVTLVIRGGPGAPTVINYDVGSAPAMVAVADFDAANGPDIAVTNSGDDTVTVLYNHGDGRFWASEALDVGDEPTGIVAADFTASGFPDLLVANSGDGTVTLWSNPAGAFTSSATSDVGPNPQMLAAGSFNGDADLDAVVANYDDGTVSVLLGAGAGSFDPAVDYAVGAEPYGVAVGDFEPDGNLDLAVTNAGDDTFTVLFGQGDGTFAGAVDYNTAGMPMAVVVEDFDLDGFDDVAVACAAGVETEIFFNDALGAGDLVFTNDLYDDVLTALGRPVALVAGDFDGNADNPGLAIVDAELDTVRVWENGVGAFTFPSGSNDLSVGWYDGAAAGTLSFVLMRQDGTWIDYGYNDHDIVWTPETNDVYVLAVMNANPDEDTLVVAGNPNGYTGTYQIDLAGIGTIALGSITAGADIGAADESAPVVTASVGDVGDIAAAQNIVDLTIDVVEGSLRRVSAATYGGTLTVTTFYDIGLITGGDLANADLLAKRDLEEIRLTGDLASADTPSSIAARRHIGQIVVGGGFYYAVVEANEDGLGDPGFIDLIDVSGNFGRLDPTGYISLRTGVGGDVRFLNVGGNVNVWEAGWMTRRDPLPVDSTSPADLLRIVDDSGGVLQMALPAGTTASYLTYPVEGGVGVAIVNLTIDGPAGVTVTGDVQAAELELNAAAATDTYQLAGDQGTLDVYLLTHTGTAESIDSTTTGSILHANVGTLNRFSVRGNLGIMEFAGGGATAEILSPVANTQAPGGGMLNGLVSTQDVGAVLVDGAVRDAVVQGDLGSLIVNADGITPNGDFHGLVGFVYGGNIGVVDVGDGLVEAAPSQYATAGIFSPGTIGDVRIDGAQTVVEGPIIGQTEITRISAAGGASLIGAIASIDLADWQWGTDLPVATQLTGSIGTIALSGAGTNITDVRIRASGLGAVTGTGGTEGVATSTISIGNLGIGTLSLDGPGLIDSLVNSSASIDAIRATGPTGAIADSTVYARANITNISAYDVTDNTITAENTIGNVTVGNDLTSTTFNCGGFGAIKVGGDMIGLDLTAAGPVKSVLVAGTASGNLDSTGPFADIGKIQTGAMDMDVVCEGRVAYISTAPGADMDLDLSVTGRNASLGKLISGGYLHGNLTIQGPASEITAYGELATPGQLIYVDGDAGRISTRGVTAVDIAANIVVNGVLGLLDSAAGITGRVEAAAGISRLAADGDVSGNIISGTEIKSMQIVGGDLLGTVTALLDIVKVDVQALAGVGGDINGDITSTLGAIRSVRTRGGDLNGDVTAAGEVRSVDALADSAGGGDINGSVRAVNAGVRAVNAKGGSIAGNVRAFAEVVKVTATGGVSGDVTSDTADVRAVTAQGGDVSGTVTAARDIVSVAATGGDLSGNFIAARDVRKLSARGGDLTGTVAAGRDVQSVTVSGSGDVSGQVQAGGTIRRIAADTATGATIAAGADLQALSFTGDVDSSYFLAGYDTGADLLVGGGDDVLLGGDVGAASFRADFINSVVAAGVGPGVNGVFEGNGSDDEVAGGESRIRGVTIGGAAVDGALASYGVFADTAVGTVREGAATRPDGYVEPGTGRFKVSSVDGADVVPAGTFPLASGTPVVLTDAADGDTVTVLLSGAGTGTVSTDTGTLTANRITTIQLDGVSSSGSSLKITVRAAAGGDGRFSLDLIEMGDDDALKSLDLRSLDLNGSGGSGIDMDGHLGSLTVANIADAAAVNVGGDLLKLTAAAIGNADITVGGAAQTVKLGRYAGGTFTARDLKKLDVKGGDLAADLNITGGAGRASVNVTGGDLLGSVTSAFDLTGVKVKGAAGVGGNIAGDVTATAGGIRRVDASGGDISGNITAGAEVNSVSAKAVGGVGGGITGDIAAGSFIKAVKATGGDVTGQIAAGGNVDAVTVKDGDVNGGVVYAGGAIKNVRLSGSGDLINGTVAARFGITSVSLVNLTGSAIAAGTDLRSFRASGSVTDSNVLAGYWVGPDMTFGSADDQLAAGTLSKASITGDLRTSSFAAGVGPGSDGLFGTDDDTSLESHSALSSLFIGGTVVAPATAQGILAATELGSIRNGSGTLGSFGNLTVATRPNAAGGPRVILMTPTPSSVALKLSEAILPETLTAATLIVEDSGFVPLTAASISFNLTTMEAVFTYSGPFPNDFYTVTLVGTGGSPVTDRGGTALDGDGTVPTGDGIPGGDFTDTFAIPLS